MKIPCEGCIVFPMCYNRNVFYDEIGSRIFNGEQFHKCSKLIKCVEDLHTNDIGKFSQELTILFKIGTIDENSM